MYPQSDEMEISATSNLYLHPEVTLEILWKNKITVLGVIRKTAIGIPTANHILSPCIISRRRKTGKRTI